MPSAENPDSTVKDECLGMQGLGVEERPRPTLLPLKVSGCLRHPWDWRGKWAAGTRNTGRKQRLGIMVNQSDTRVFLQLLFLNLCT